MLKNKPLTRLAIVAQALVDREITRKQVTTAAVAGVSFFAMLTAVATVPERTPISSEVQVESVLLKPLSLAEGSDAAYWYEERFARDDTFGTLLRRLQVDAVEASRLVRDASTGALLKLLKPGTAVQANVTAEGRLLSLRFVASGDQLVGIDRVGDGFRLVDRNIVLSREIVTRAAYVRNSLFAAADEAGVPDSVARQLGEIFGAEIDFHRNFRRGDRFTVAYEMFHHDGRLIRPGRVLAAEVTIQGRSLRALWFEQGETMGYYTPQGTSLKQAFLRSPLEVSRITSGFEMRMNPLSREWQSHKGIDYAAPIGTPVRATSEGIVEFAGQQSGYGNVVILQHRGGYTTLYAHLNDFASGIRQGSRVAQGEVIGEVGRTGWATGPHLHYEFRIKGEHVDPLTAALPTATPLAPAQLGQFRSSVAPLVARLDLLKNTTLASAE